MPERDGADMFNVLVSRANPRPMDGVQVNWDTTGGEDGSFYPLVDPNNPPDWVRREADDEDSDLIAATGFELSESVGGHAKELSRATNTVVWFQVTESRVVVVCEKWRASPSAYILMGHIRYNWLGQVAWGRSIPMGQKRLRLACIDGLGPYKDRWVRIDLTLSRDVDGRALLDDIAARAARFYLRLNRPNLSDEKKKALHELAAVRRPPTEAKQWVVQQMPAFQRVNFQTVYRSETTFGEPGKLITDTATRAAAPVLNNPPSVVGLRLCRGCGIEPLLGYQGDNCPDCGTKLVTV